MEICGEVEVQLHASLPSEPEGGEWSVSCPLRFNPGEGPIILVSEPEFALEQAMKTQMGVCVCVCVCVCRYSSTLSLTSALEGVGDQRHAPVALRPVKRLGGPQGRSGQMRKISAPTVFDPRTLHPVASRCTD